MSADTTELLDPDELLRMPDGDGYELIDGVPREKPMGAKADEIAGMLVTALNNFIRPWKLGRAYPSKTGFKCFPGKPNLVRLPDASFVAAGRLVGGDTPDGHIPLAPDIAVEVVSPNDFYEEVEEKVGEYLSAGVKLVWVISRTSGTALVRRANGSCAWVDRTGSLSGEDALPGFAVALNELFE